MENRRGGVWRGIFTRVETVVVVRGRRHAVLVEQVNFFVVADLHLLVALAEVAPVEEEPTDSGEDEENNNHDGSDGTAREGGRGTARLCVVTLT